MKMGGLTAVAALTGGIPSIAKTKDQKVNKSTHKLKLGLASYSLRKFDTEQTVKMMARVGLTHVCLKSMHLPLDSDQAAISKTKVLLEQYGIKLAAGGVIYMKTKEEVDQAFKYAKKAGMEMIVGVPAHSLLAYVETKVKEYNIILAIHNHGPGDEQYPSLGSIYDKIKDLDERIGMCHDIGHTQRIKLDPIKETVRYFERIYDFHIKDVDQANADGKNIEIGHGVIDVVAFLQLLTAMKFEGTVSFEYEKDADDPLPGLAESVGYVNGVLAVI